MRKEATFGLLFILEALEPPEKEKLAQNLAVTPSQYHTECWEESIWVGACIIHVRT